MHSCWPAWGATDTDSKHICSSRSVLAKDFSINTTQCHHSALVICLPAVCLSLSQTAFLLSLPPFHTLSSLLLPPSGSLSSMLPSFSPSLTSLTSSSQFSSFLPISLQVKDI